MEDDTMVQVSMERYNKLLEKERILEALYASGVDNWDWYDDAMESLNEKEE